MLSQDEFWKMPMGKLEKEVARYSPGSAAWDNSWPILQIRTRRIETRRVLIYVSISTLIALIALIRTLISK
jgi:hypothetical protein